MSQTQMEKIDATIPVFPDNLLIANNAGHHLSKGKKLVKKVKEKKTNSKTIWIAGHTATIFFGFIYSFYYFQFKQFQSKIAMGSYKLALISIWVTYIISIKTQYNIKSLTRYSSLIASENFEYFLLSVFWFFNRSSFFKILPYMMISILHLATNFNLDFILNFEKQFAAVFLYNEIFVFFLLLLDTLLIRGTSGYGFVVYTYFSWLRLLQSENTRFFLYAQLIRLDAFVTKIKNEKVQASWKVIKKFLSTRQAKFEQEFL